jgi:transposase-like protein
MKTEGPTTDFTINCNKCKKVEDTFTADEKPEDFGWIKYRGKWYCASCYKTYIDFTEN